MKIRLLIVLFSCATQLLLSQENDGVVSFDVPVRNSLMFNRYTINPTFSFVREQHKFASIYNKREWVQFNDAPLTYLASYSGRFAENIGAGVGLFQQNYGVLTTFGGILNFAYNARIDRDNNLTFGLNIGAYSSGINTNNTTTNFADPSLQNVPSNFLLTVNPGINYGTTFLDFGVAVNNLFVYNLENSSMLKDDPNQGIQAHVMYTGYMSSRGFFDDSRFSGLLRSEFTEDETIISANAMVYVPKGLWFQGGYNSLYGASGGVGINITKEIAIEYNFETAFGDFGPSHEVTLAYRFKNERYFDYSRQDEVSGLISTDKKPRRRVVASRKPERKIVPAVKTKNPEAEALLKLDQENAQLEAERLAKEKAEAERLKEAQEEAARLAKIEEERLAEQKRIARAKIEADKRAKALEEQKQRQEAERLAKLERERIAEQKRIADEKLAAERRAKELEAQKEQEETDRLAKIESERLAKEKADEEAIKLEAERLAKEKAENELIANPKDEFGRAMLSLTKDAEDDKTKQSDLLEQYNKAVEGKNENLKNLKEENDLGDQGIVVKPKAFKSVTKENDRLRAIKTELDDVILKRNQKIKELEELYDDMYEADTIVNELVMLYYKKEIAELKKEQRNANDIKLDLENKLEQIQIGIEFEKRRRIKRAEYDNEEERYAQDRATLKNLKASTDIGTANLEPEDFDFGIEQSNNITILKNVNYTESGYYMVLAVHTDTEKRDEFITKAIASGVADIEFFYDVNTSQYFIYQKKFNSVQEANSTIKQRGTKSYNSKMTIIKIEN